MLGNRNQENKSAAAKLKELMKAKAEGSADAAPEALTVAPEEPEPSSASETPGSAKKRKVDEVEDLDNGTPGRNTPIVKDSPAPPKDAEMPEDTIKLWEPGT